MRLLRAFPSPITFGVLLAAMTLTACNSEERTEALIQARLDSERVKTLTATNVKLEAENARLVVENSELKAKVAGLESRGVARRAAATPAQPRRSAETARAPSAASPAEIAELKEQATGGGSFK